MTEGSAGEPTIETKVMFQGRIMEIRVDTVRLASGRTTTREIVEHSDSVCIVPLDEAGNVVLVRQYRKPVEGDLLEVPAGGIEGDEVSEEAVLRELQEETGYVADQLLHLSSFWTTPGFCTELMHAYLATGLTPSVLQQDEDENVEAVKVPLDTVPDMIRRGEIRDAKSIASLLMVLFLNNQ